MSTPVKTSWVPISAPTSAPAAGGEAFTGYLALPPAGKGPGLLLWQEIFGVNEHIRAVADSYALAGFVVLAPDIFWRTDRRVEMGYSPDDITRGRGIAMAMKPELVQADILAALAALRARPETAGAKLGTIGYCLGGRLAYLTAALGDVQAAVPYYGGGIHTQLDLASRVRCPIQFHYAETDANIPPEAVQAVRDAFAARAATLPAEVHVYPGSTHGFNCWARGSYHPPSAALALGRSMTFLAQRLF
jgi:carboxymethylenebutenolidase